MLLCVVVTLTFLFVQTSYSNIFFKATWPPNLAPPMDI